MNDTPRTDREIEINASGSDWDDFLHADFVRTLERELADAKREIERLDVAGIHSCHADCPRYACALKRERDSLADALRKIASGAHGWQSCVDKIAPEALATIKP